MKICERGKQVLSKPPEKITVGFLGQFPEFQAFRAMKNASDEIMATKGATRESDQTPEELFEESYQERKEELIDQLLEKIMLCSPAFFERLVVDTLVRMGYGGSRIEAGKAIGRSGDEGVDGVISEDRLGLDMIYIQAKRREANVSRPEVQKFAGALQGKRARKGVFITTSDYSAEAREFAQNIDARIVLLSGRQFLEFLSLFGSSSL